MKFHIFFMKNIFKENIAFLTLQNNVQVEKKKVERLMKNIFKNEKKKT